MLDVRQKRKARERRKARIRAKVHGSASRPRLSVFKSLRYIEAQLIDDDQGVTLVSASDRKIKGGTKTDRAKKVGEQLAKLALKKGIKEVVFDRGGYKYHGRVKALAEGARAQGLKF